MVGGHKAVAIARVLEHASVWLVSKLPEDKVRACGLTPYGTLRSVQHDAIYTLGSGACVGVIPDGRSALPKIGWAARELS